MVDSEPNRYAHHMNRIDNHWYHVVKTTISYPFGNGLYMFIPPISGDDWGMVYYCFNHINHGLGWFHYKFGQVLTRWVWCSSTTSRMILKPTSIVWDARGETEGLEERSPSSFRSTGTVARHRRMKFVDIPGVESGSSMSIPIAQVSNHWTRNGSPIFTPKRPDRVYGGVL